MSILDGVELINSGRMRPFITLRDASITFSKTAIECLDYAEFIHVFLDEPGRRVAFQVSGDDDASYVFYRKPKPGRSMMVRIAGKRLAGKVKKLAQIENCEGGLRFYGEYVEDEKLILFNMSKPGVSAQKEE